MTNTSVTVEARKEPIVKKTSRQNSAIGKPPKEKKSKNRQIEYTSDVGEDLPVDLRNMKSKK